MSKINIKFAEKAEFVVTPLFKACYLLSVLISRCSKYSLNPIAMKRILLLLVSTLMVQGLYAQVKPQNVEVAGGDVLNNVVDKKLQYAFDDFTEGAVLHNNGNLSRAKLNYSYLVNEMQYIDSPTGDTLALMPSSDIMIISISGRKFIPRNKEYVELLSEGLISLGVKRTNKLLSTGAKGAYGTSTNTSAITSMNHISTNMGGDQSLSVLKNMQISLDSHYYLIEIGSNKFTFVANRKSFLKAYPKDKATLIEQYVNENKIDFEKEEDLIKLTSYCNQL